MPDDTSPRARAIGALAEMFTESAFSCRDFASFEHDSIGIGHECISEALALALEALDARLMGERPAGLVCHDVRRRTLATEVGDVDFSIRRYRDRFGCDVYLLADVLDIPYGSRISPGAAGFLVQAAAHVSYARSAALLARHGSRVRPTTVMRLMRETGSLCTEEDERAARSLYADGVIPDAECAEEELSIEADGTYFRVQGAAEGGPRRCEVKAMVAYGGKRAEHGKVRRLGAVRHALVGESSELWSQGIARTGEKYDLAKAKRVHLGSDGEPWCRQAERYLPKSDVTFHLDPFHVNRAVMACVKDKKLAWNIIDVIDDGGTDEAVALIKACKDFGLAQERRADAAIGYLEGNKDAISVDGPSLGTMESENQHLYGARMDSVPCAWSVKGASDMARIISRRESGKEIPRMTRERSAGRARAERRERKELSFYGREGSAGRMVESVGVGYLPPHQADTRKMRTGKAYALHKGMAILDRGI